MSDATLIQELRPVIERYAGCAEDRAGFFRCLVNQLEVVASVEEKLAAQKRRGPRPPSGQFAGVTAALGTPDHSRAKTEKHDMKALVEEAEAEYRDTPVIPDPRRDP